jgi:hypothetical protein
MYLIDRFVMKPIIDRIVVFNSSQNALVFKIIAGLQNPCIPAECCIQLKNSSSDVLFNGISPCIDSKFGFQAERYLFKLAPTFVLNLPIVSCNLSNIMSELRKDNEYFDSDKISAVKRLKSYINDLIVLQTPLPSFIKIGCNKLLI